ncbi:MAG TPA: hypothetical protein VFE90_03815, partial [Myxococcales bacterium]|nr:hypothetical protein [Myxococcales bacterium]
MLTDYLSRRFAWGELFIGAVFRLSAHAITKQFYREVSTMKMVRPLEFPLTVLVLLLGIGSARA